MGRGRHLKIVTPTEPHGMTDHKEQLMEVAKSAPPIAATGAVFAGYHLHDWMVLLTIVWLACQIGGWIWDRFFKEPK